MFFGRERKGKTRAHLAFLDPPYDLPDEELAGDLALLAPLLAPGALVIVERSSRSAAPDWESVGMAAYRERGYGDTTLWWGEPA